jgi:glycosyltransferase involved in cell wall biosynthesis
MSNNSMSSDKLATLAVIVPCYNEEEVLKETTRRLTALMDTMAGEKSVSDDSYIWYVDDGSEDGTWALIEDLKKDNPRVCGLKLAANRGHQNALLAGLSTVEADITVSIDADLQDDINVIPQMVEEYRSGAEIVYGIRKARDSDSFFKRTSAHFFYKLLHVMGVSVEFNHADTRLMSRRALDALKQYDEVNLYLRGLIPTIGFKTARVEYDRTERLAGESKYPLTKMLALAVDGITSFSAVPLRLIAGLGMIIFIGSLVTSAWVLWVRFVSQIAIPGWASSVLPMYLLGGIQLLGIGILGEYTSKIYMETKRRPRFIVEKVLD